MEELKLGRVYKIICTMSDNVYVGSTFKTIEERWSYHKYIFQSWLRGNGSTISIYPSMKEYGVENFKIELIKEYQVCDRKHLEMYETFNMGMDYAIFLSEKDISKAQKVIIKSGFDSIDAGWVEKGEKQVIIKPKNLVYKSETLDLR